MRRIATTLYSTPEGHFTAERLIHLLNNLAEHKEEHSITDRIELGNHRDLGPFVTVYCQGG